MAYVDRFIFRFNSVSGKAVRIAIADNGYTGEAVERRLGGSPQLRCELSGNIHGMSLEIPAECKVDDEFAVLYTSDPTRFAVRLEVDNVVVWRGFVTPELYAAPWVDPPYDVQITATDGLGELKMMEWPAIGSRTLKEILDTVLGATGLALGIRMISAAANDIAAAEDLLTGTTVNLDHMAGKSYYDVLDGLLGSLHCTISQRNGVWLLVRETDVTSLTSDGQVSDTSGNTYPVKSFGSSQTHDCWPVGRLTTEIVPAKSVVEVECPNHLASLIADPDMELNLWQTNGSWTGEDGGYYTLDLNEYISQVITVANASRDADPGFRIKVSSRHTTPFGVGIMRLTVMATGRDPRSGSDKTLYLKEVTTQGRTQMEWVTEESHFDDGLGLPRTLDHQDCKEFETDIFRLPTSFNPLKSITVKVTAGKSTVCVHSVHIECMSVYDKAVTRLVMDNGARGDESNSPLFADSFVGNKGNFLLTNSLRGVAGAIVRTWSSDAIPSVPYGEWLSKDMALSVATPRLRMSGRLFTVTSLPALFYSNKGLSYITEEWSLDLIEDEADISLISLPAAALSTVSVSVIVEDNDGRQGAVSGGEIVSPKTGEAVSSSSSLDWFISESYEEEGETRYRLKLNPKYQGMYAEGWVSAGGVGTGGGGGGGDYLPLVGGTMSGSINMPTGSSTNTGPILRFQHESGGSQVFDAYVGANNGGTLAIYAANDIRLRPGNSSSHGLIITTTDITYNGVSLKPKFFYGTSSSSGTARSVTASGFTSANLTAGTVLVVQMANSLDTSSNVTVNVNSTGNKYIYAAGEYKSWKAGENIILVYTSSSDWAILPTYEYIIQHISGGGGGSTVSGVSTVVGRSGDVTVTHIADALTGAGYNLSAYTLPAATSNALGGIRIGYTQSGKNYPVLLDSGNRAYVNVPWQSGSGGSTVSVAQGAITSATNGTEVGSITVDGTRTTLYAPKVTVTQIQETGVEVARIRVGSANPVSIFAPSGGSGESGVQTVVGKTGDVTTTDIANALTTAGYKLTDTVPDLSSYVTTQRLSEALSDYATTQSLDSYLPLSAGSGKALTDTLYARTIRPSTNSTSQSTGYDLGASTAFWKNTYTRRVYLYDGIYVYYDTTNNCIRTNAPIVSDSYISAGGVSTT